jgi:predicted O-methyltransferase YrrM
VDNSTALLSRIQDVRRELVRSGPPRTRDVEGDDFERVTVPEADCDAIRDTLIAEKATTVIEIGLAYARSALAIGEALVSAGGEKPRHLVFDPFQESGYRNAGWDSIRAAGLDRICELSFEPSQIALPRLVTDGFVADAAFVDGSHHFHNVFVDMYFLWKLVRPGGLVILDDYHWPSVGTAARYYETNLGWEPVLSEGGGRQRVRVLRLPDPPFEPGFDEFVPF